MNEGVLYFIALVCAAIAVIILFYFGVLTFISKQVRKQLKTLSSWGRNLSSNLSNSQSNH